MIKEICFTYIVKDHKAGWQYPGRALLATSDSLSLSDSEIIDSIQSCIRKVEIVQGSLSCIYITFDLPKLKKIPTLSLAFKKEIIMINLSDNLGCPRYILNGAALSLHSYKLLTSQIEKADIID